MDDLRRMVIFYHVVEAQSFAGAARQLGIARSAVSRHISLLEHSVGARLLNRTTRSLSLTEVGKTYYQSCARIVNEAQLATQRVSQLQDEPCGTLKVAGPVSIGSQRIVGPLITDFMARYPALNVELSLDDRVVDMVEEGIDVSIRIGWLPDSNLVARKLADAPRYLCASPGYVERHGQPETPAQLAEHEWIVFTLLPAPLHITLKKNAREYRIQLNSRVRTNSVIAVRSFLLEGAGITALPNFQVEDDIQAGRLVRILADYDCGSAGIYAVYQDRHYQQARVRLFVEFMARVLKRYV